MYKIEYATGVTEDLEDLRVYDRTRILNHIEEQLAHQPAQETRNKKKLTGLIPPWDHVEPVWELRVDEYRIFYDVDEERSVVTIRAIRHKPPDKTTEEIL